MTSIQLGFAPLTYEPSTLVKLVSAGTGACLAEAATYPLDMAKVRLMLQGEGETFRKKTSKLRYTGVWGTIRTVANSEGVTGLYAGMVAGFHRQLIFGSVRIGCYDAAKKFYSNIFDRSRTDPTQTGLATKISAGSTTGLMAVVAGQPTDVVKVRMQAQGATGIVRYTSAVNAYTTIFKEEGVVGGLWKGVQANAMRMVIVNTSEIVSYDLFKQVLVKHKIMTDNAPCHFVAAVGAAMVCVAMASPVDVIKTRYMNSTPGQYKGIADCARKMWMEKGIPAFYKGCLPNFYRLCTWSIIMFMSYEQLKRGLSHSIYGYQRNMEHEAA